MAPLIVIVVVAEAAAGARDPEHTSRHEGDGAASYAAIWVH